MSGGAIYKYEMKKNSLLTEEECQLTFLEDGFHFMSFMTYLMCSDAFCQIVVL